MSNEEPIKKSISDKDRIWALEKIVKHLTEENERLKKGTKPKRKLWRWRLY